MRIILGIGKGDAFFRDRKHLIGQRCKTVKRSNNNYHRGSYISAHVTLDKPIDFYSGVGYTFLEVRLSKK